MCPMRHTTSWQVRQCPMRHTTSWQVRQVQRPRAHAHTHTHTHTHTHMNIRNVHNTYTYTHIHTLQHTANAEQHSAHNVYSIRKCSRTLAGDGASKVDLVAHAKTDTFIKIQLSVVVVYLRCALSSQCAPTSRKLPSSSQIPAIFLPTSSGARAQLFFNAYAGCFAQLHLCLLIIIRIPFAFFLVHNASEQQRSTTCRPLTLLARVHAASEQSIKKYTSPRTIL
jgi:hypothetical protein